MANNNSKATAQRGSRGKTARIAGVAALSGAAAAGYYFFMSKHAKQNRRIAARWATSMRGDVLRQAKKLKNVDKRTFLNIVNTAAQTYSAARKLDRREIERAARELRDNWQRVVREAGSRASAAKKSLTTSSKRPARKRSTSKKGRKTTGKGRS
jgi:hypothetical protein